MADNPLSCDSGLLWLYLAQNMSLHLADPLGTLCYWPDHLRGQPLITLSPDDFVDCECLQWLARQEGREQRTHLHLTCPFSTLPFPPFSRPLPLPLPSPPLQLHPP